VYRLILFFCILKSPDLFIMLLSPTVHYRYTYINNIPLISQTNIPTSYKQNQSDGVQTVKDGCQWYKDEMWCKRHSVAVSAHFP